MKSKWILTLTAAAVGMSMMLAGCGGKDTASDGSATHSNPSSHAGTSSAPSKTEGMGTMPGISDNLSNPEATGGLGDMTGNITDHSNQSGTR